MEVVDYLRAFPLLAFEVSQHPPMELHRHGTYVELVIVMEGSGRHLLEGHSFSIGEGDVFVIPSNTLHGYSHCNNLGLINVLFDQKRLELPERQLLRIPGYSALFTYEPQLRSRHQFESRLRISKDVVACLRTTLAQTREEVDSRRPGFDAVSTGYLTQVLVELARQYGTMTDSKSQALVKLSDLLEWLEHNFETTITAESLASRASMSQSTLTRSFRQCFGVSPMNYVIGLRIRRAERLLLAPDARVKEIAPQVGIGNTSYFARLFKQHTGLDPTAYRSLHRGE